MRYFDIRYLELWAFVASLASLSSGGASFAKFEVEKSPQLYKNSGNLPKRSKVERSIQLYKDSGYLPKRSSAERSVQFCKDSEQIAELSRAKRSVQLYGDSGYLAKSSLVQRFVQLDKDIGKLKEAPAEDSTQAPKTVMIPKEDSAKKHGQTSGVPVEKKV